MRRNISQEVYSFKKRWLNTVSVKFYFFDNIDDCMQLNIVEQLREVSRYIVIFSNRLEF